MNDPRSPDHAGQGGQGGQGVVQGVVRPAHDTGLEGQPGTVLVLGATGQTGRHFVDLALARGHPVRALARDPSKLARQHVVHRLEPDSARDPARALPAPAGELPPGLSVRQGSVTQPDLNLDSLVEGVEHVVCMLGDLDAQQHQAVFAPFVRSLVPALRRHPVRTLVYQAGALSRPPGRALPPPLALIRRTLNRAHTGQHEDNEAVMQYLTDQAHDIAWVVHRAGIGSDGPTKGVLARSTRFPSVATFGDCAAYNYRLLTDPGAVHTSDLSRYETHRHRPTRPTSEPAPP